MPLIGEKRKLYDAARDPAEARERKRRQRAREKEAELSSVFSAAYIEKNRGRFTKSINTIKLEAMEDAKTAARLMVTYGRTLPLCDKFAPAFLDEAKAIVEEEYSS